MNILPLLPLFLVGCAAPTSELMAEAKECVANQINPTEEETKACWSDVNRRLESDANRQAIKDAEMTCSKHLIAVCKVWGREKDCVCVSRLEIR